MELNDFIWLVAFSFLFFALNLIQYLMVNSLKDKPLGSQSIYDSAMRDQIFGTKVYGSYVCLMYMAARFEEVRYLFVTNKTVLTAACTLYYFGFSTMCVKTAGLCIVRVLCIFKMTYLEESVGEFKLRLVTSAFSLTVGFVASLILVLREEINSGSFKTLLTAQASKSGKFIHSFKTVILNLLLFFPCK